MNQLRAGALLSYAAMGINVLIGLLYTPWMISSIGKEDYGLYTLALSVISIFVFDFGIGQAVTRFLAKYIAEGNQEKANNCLGLIYKLYIYLDLVVLIVLSVLYFFIPLIYKELTPEELSKFEIIYMAVAFYSVFSFPFIPVNGVLTANEKFIQLKVCDLAHKVIIVVLMSICLLLGYGLYALVTIHVLSGCLTILFKLFFIKRDTDTKINFKYENRTEFKEIVGFSGWVTVKSLSERMIFTISPSILGMVSGSVEIALFGIANVIEGYVYNFSGALNGLFLPKVAKISSKEGGDIMPLMIKIGRLLFFIVGFITVGFICVGQNFIRVWLGDGYDATYVSSILIILPSLFYVPQEIACNAIAVQNKVKSQAIVYLIMGVCNLILGYYLAMTYGCIGLCISIFIAYNIRNIGLNIIFKKQLQLNISLFFKSVFLNMGIPMIICLALAYLVNLIALSGWIGFIVKGVIVSMIYILGMWLLTLNQSEKHLFYEPVKNIFTKLMK